MKKKKEGIMERLFKHFINQLFKFAIFLIAAVFIFILVLGSEYKFSLKRADRVFKEQISTFQKYAKGIEVLKFMAKVF